MAIKGKDFIAKVSSTGAAGSFTTIQGINDISYTIEGDNIDVTTMGSAQVKRMQGLMDSSGSLSGFHEPGDAAGQTALRQALLNGGGIVFMQFLQNGVNGFQQEMIVASFEPSGSVDGVVETSYELEGNGPITIV